MYVCVCVCVCCAHRTPYRMAANETHFLHISSKILPQTHEFQSNSLLSTYIITFSVFSSTFKPNFWNGAYFFNYFDYTHPHTHTENLFVNVFVNRCAPAVLSCEVCKIRCYFAITCASLVERYFFQILFL